MSKLILVFSVLYIFFSSLESKPFANNFIEMNIPDNWDCAPYRGELWTCEPMPMGQNDEIIMVMTFAEQGPEDTLSDFYDHLNSNMMMATDPTTGEQHPSTPINMQYKNILGQRWVDSQHLSTALPDYFTRYLVTVKDGRIVLVAVTVQKDVHSRYMAQLYKTIESMRIRMTMPAAPTQTGLEGLVGTLGDITRRRKDPDTGAVVEIEVSEGMDWALALVLALVVAGLVYYFIRKRRRKKKIPKKKLFR